MGTGRGWRAGWHSPAAPVGASAHRPPPPEGLTEPARFRLEETLHRHSDEDHHSRVSVLAMLPLLRP